MSGDIIVQVNYNLISQVESIILGKTGGGQVTLEYKYHFNGWIRQISAKNSLGTELYGQTLRYEDGTSPRFDGTIAGYNYSLVAESVKQFAFGYDPLGRLTSASTNLTSQTEVDGGVWGYQYADNGAITRLANANQAFVYAYSQGNRLDHVVASGIPSSTRDYSGTGTFSYDSNGRMVVDNSKQMDIEYDDVTDLATTFNVGANTSLKNFLMAYDDAGNRISKMEYQGTALQFAKNYTSFGKEMRFGPSGWEDIYPFETYGRMSKAADGSWRMEGYVSNHLGSTAEIYNLVDGTEIYSTDYSPYGKLRLETMGTGAAVTEKFTGKEFDEGIDLDYFGARYYDADLGMWISPDPMRQFHSPYSFSSDPINTVDPDGNLVKVTGDDPGGFLNHAGGEIFTLDKSNMVEVNQSFIGPLTETQTQLSEMARDPSVLIKINTSNLSMTGRFDTFNYIPALIREGRTIFPAVNARTVFLGDFNQSSDKDFNNTAMLHVMREYYYSAKNKVGWESSHRHANSFLSSRISGGDVVTGSSLVGSRKYLYGPGPKSVMFEYNFFKQKLNVKK